jgi:hypothetical protein
MDPRDLFRRATLMPGRLFDSFEMMVRVGETIAKHDPCENCGHGRLLHARLNYTDPDIAAADRAMPEGQCRHGHFCAQEPKIRPGCECPAWVGTKTPLPPLPKLP